MSDQGNTKGVMGFVIGALVVVVAGLGWYIYSGGDPFGQKNQAEIKIQLPGSN